MSRRAGPPSKTEAMPARMWGLLAVSMIAGLTIGWSSASNRGSEKSGYCSNSLRSAPAGPSEARQAYQSSLEPVCGLRADPSDDIRQTVLKLAEQANRVVADHNPKSYYKVYGENEFRGREAALE